MSSGIVASQTETVRPATRGVVEAGLLDGVEDRLDGSERVAVAAVVDERADVALDHLVVDVGVVGRQALTVEDDAADRGLEARGVLRDVDVLVLALARQHAEDLAVAVREVGVGGGHANGHGLLQVERRAFMSMARSASSKSAK